MGRRTRNRARLNPDPERSLRSDKKAQPALPPGPQIDEPSRPLWPFLTAFALVAAVLAYIFLTADRGDPGPTNAQKIRTLTEQYVAAYNAGDQARMKQLSCAGLTDAESPLHGEPTGIAIARMRSL